MPKGQWRILRLAAVHRPDATIAECRCHCILYANIWLQQGEAVARHLINIGIRLFQQEVRRATAPPAEIILRNCRT